MLCRDDGKQCAPKLYRGKPVKFTAEQVLEMRRLARKEGLGPTEIMRRMGIVGSQAQEIVQIIRYKTYTWVRPVS